MIYNNETYHVIYEQDMKEAQSHCLVTMGDYGNLRIITPFSTRCDLQDLLECIAQEVPRQLWDCTDWVNDELAGGEDENIIMCETVPINGGEYYMNIGNLHIQEVPTELLEHTLAQL